MFNKRSEKNGLVEQIGSKPHEKPTFGATFLNPMILMLRKISVKTFLDPKHPNSNTDESSESGLELLAT